MAAGCPQAHVSTLPGPSLHPSSGVMPTHISFQHEICFGVKPVGDPGGAGAGLRAEGVGSSRGCRSAAVGPKWRLRAPTLPPLDAVTNHRGQTLWAVDRTGSRSGPQLPGGAVQGVTEQELGAMRPLKRGAGRAAAALPEASSVLERVSVHEGLSQGGTPRERQAARDDCLEGHMAAPHFQTHPSAPSVPGSACPLTCAHLHSPALTCAHLRSPELTCPRVLLV